MPTMVSKEDEDAPTTWFALCYRVTEAETKVVMWADTNWLSGPFLICCP